MAIRTVPELKDKWGLLKRATTHKKADVHKTGGGKGLPAPEYEDIVVSILGDNTSLINGIEVLGTESFVAAQADIVQEPKLKVDTNQVAILQTAEIPPRNKLDFACDVADLNASDICIIKHDFPTSGEAKALTSTPQSLSSWKTSRTRKRKRTRGHGCEEEDELMKDYLRNQIIESKLRQRKLELEIELYEAQVSQLKFTQHCCET